MEKSKIEAKIIPTYRLPLFDLMAIYYTPIKLFIFLLVLLIPTITVLAVYHFSWTFILKLSPLEIACIISAIRFFLYIKDTTSYRIWCEDIKNNPDHASMYTGAPGTGKTLTAVFATYFMALGSWIKLQWEYFKLMHRLMKDENYVLTDKDKEIFESYKYFITNDGIPCLGTNIPVYSKRYKRFSYKLGPSYLKQQRRAPFRLVGLYDEIGTVFNFELSNDKSDSQKGLTISDMVRFCRQHAEFRFIGTEQEGQNMYKGIRNVVALYREYYSFDYIFKPRVLTFIFSFLRDHFVSKMKLKSAKRWGGFMDKFEEFISKVGYIKLRYRDFGHKDEVLPGKKGDGVLYFPCCSEFEYDTRAFRFAYKARNNEIKMDVFTSMKLSEEEAGAFLRANYAKKEEKKVA